MVTTRPTSRSPHLGLWMNGEFVGTWHIASDGEDVLEYDSSWKASPQGRPLSLSLPFAPRSAHFLPRPLLFWMLRAPDGHAKNFSLFIAPAAVTSSLRYTT